MCIPVFDTVVGRVTRAECPSNCKGPRARRGGGNIKKLRLKERFRSCLTVPMQFNRIGKISFSPTVTRTGKTHNTTVSIKNKFSQIMKNIKKLTLEERFGSCLTVPMQFNRIGKISFSPIVNRTWKTHNTTVSTKNKFSHHLRSKRLLSDKLLLRFQTENRRGTP